MYSNFVHTYLTSKNQPKKEDGNMIKFESYREAEKLSGIVKQFAERYDLCSEGVAEFCEEVGIPAPTKEYKIIFAGTVIVTATSEDHANDLASSFESDLESMSIDNEVDMSWETHSIEEY